MHTIAVADTVWTGHIPSYHKILISSLLDLGYQVLSISPKPEEILEWTKNENELNKKNLSVIRAVSQPSNVKTKSDYQRAIEWWKELKNALSDHKPDLVFLPGIESNIISRCLTGSMVDTLFPFKWSGIYLTPKYLRKNLLRYLQKRLLRKDLFFEAENCIGICVLDEGVVPRLKSLFPGKPILTMPDFSFLETSPVPGKFEAENNYRFKDKKVIGLFGEISERKGILNFLEIAKLAEKENQPWLFLIAGPLNEKNNSPQGVAFLKSKLAKAPKNVLHYLERIPEEGEFNRLISRCDVVFAVYEKFYHSSNLLTKSAHFQKPILVAKGYCMAERVLDNRLGLTVPEGKPLPAYEALKSMINHKSFALSAEPDWQGFSQLHSIEKLNQFLQNLTYLAIKEDAC